LVEGQANESSDPVQAHAECSAAHSQRSTGQQHRKRLQGQRDWSKAQRNRDLSGGCGEQHRKRHKHGVARNALRTSVGGDDEIAKYEGGCGAIHDWKRYPRTGVLRNWGALGHVALSYHGAMTNSVADAFHLAEEAGARITAIFGRRHDLLVVLGSGWSEAIPTLEAASATPPQSIAVTEIPGFAKPSALGHGGALVSITIGNIAVLLLTGRTHLYEGHGVHAVVHGVRAAHANGCSAVLLTNGAGCLRPDWQVGTPVVITDHINLTGHSPLTGDNPPAPHAGRFVDLTDAYSQQLRDVVRSVDPTINEAVYIGLHGPHFETPAEIRAMANWGADMVGMSTVLEVIAARHLAMQVLALSLATNQAAGMSGEKLSGEEVIAVGKDSAPRVAELLRKVLVAIDHNGVIVP